MDHASPHRSVFLAALGAESRRLHPKVLRYAEGPGVGRATGEGVFEVAGSRFRWLGLLLRPLAGPHVLITRHERDVPFAVVNSGMTSPDGGIELHAVRSFHFHGGEQTFVDVLLPGSVPGTLRNILGRARRIELELRCEATSQGSLLLQSERVWIRLGRMRLRLSRLLSVRVEDGFDETSGRQTIDAWARSPILGVVLEYRGSFVYRDPRSATPA